MNITDKNIKSNNSELMRNEQIEEQVVLEIADDVRRIRESYFGRSDYLFARKLFEDGYRKQSEGEWKHHKSTAGGIHDTYRCSICDHVTGWTTTFCPNCGAKMKGGE